MAVKKLNSSTVKKPLCSVKNCSSIVLANGFCNRHSMRVYRYGNPMTVKKSGVARAVTCKKCGGVRWSGSRYKLCVQHHLEMTRARSLRWWRANRKKGRIEA